KDIENIISKKDLQFLLDLNTKIMGIAKIIIQDKKEVDIKSILEEKNKKHFKAEADDSISFKAKNNCSFTADEINTLANKESILIAQEQIISQVGKNTTITQTKDKIILQVGKIQVIIDDKGLRVKGGDLRAD
ncbi:hypothetical protein KJQ82_08510, partial [Campylobacter lari]|nr:hypothetical protein [Campylobacter lari]